MAVPSGIQSLDAPRSLLERAVSLSPTGLSFVYLGEHHCSLQSSMMASNTALFTSSPSFYTRSLGLPSHPLPGICILLFFPLL